MQLPLCPVFMWVQCPGNGHLSKRGWCQLNAVCLSPVWQLLEIQAQYHRQSLESLDSALAELRESHRQTGTLWLSVQPGKGCSCAWGIQVCPEKLEKANFPSLHLLLPTMLGW